VNELSLEAGVRFQTFAESSMEARISADRDGRIIYVNKRSEALFGYTADELLGQPLTVLIPERFRELHDRGVERFETAEEHPFLGQTVELTALRRDGLEFPIELSLASWSTGGERFFFGNIRDITERKRAEEERQRLLGQLRELTDARERLLLDLAHDLRVPLVSLELVTSLYRELEPAKLDEAMTQARRMLSHLQGLVDDMLNASSIEAGQLDVEPKPVPLREVVDAALEAAGPLFESANQHVRCSLPREPLMVLADRKHIVRALFNLLSNASKYSHGGSAILLRARAAGNEARIQVIDHGHGIAPEHQSRVFERFFRANPERRRPGVGLGLAIVKGIAEAHGGRVGVDSTPGKGSCFWLSLPLTTPDSAAGSLPPSRQAG